MDDAAVIDDAAADTGAEGEQDKVVDVAAGTVPLFAEGGGVGVILEDDGCAELLADGIAQGEVFERFEVIGTEDDALAQADETGDADADTE